ncbi:MAG: hypothetical protein JWP87_162 [Labilithrix sp.]|nr:hypothetical protein [Labilithrix sp.]
MTTHVTEPAREAVSHDSSGSTGSAGSTGSSRVVRSARAAWIGLGTVALLAVLVFWLFEALPFQDLPAHAGLIAMRHRFTGLSGEFESRFFVLAPHIGPYSLFRFLGEVFVRVIGPVGAVRALATLPVIATPLALLHARRRLHGDRSPTYGFLGITLSFGFMTLMGFASYLLGVAVMLFGLVMWLELLAAADDDAPDLRKREVLMAVFAPIIFVAHGHAFALFLLCAGVSALCTGPSRARIMRFRTLVPALGLASWVAWIERGATTPAGSVPVVPPLMPVFHSPAAKFELLVTPTLMTRSGIDFLVGVAFWVFAIACTFYSVRALGRQSGREMTAGGGSARHSRALYACAGALFVLFLALPHAIGWFGFVDGRLLPLVLMLALLGMRREALPRPLEVAADIGAPVSAATMAMVALVASYFFQHEARGYREVLAHVPAHATLLNLPLEPNSDVFTGHPFIHYDKLALADRPVVVSDVWFHQGSALYPTPANPALRLPASYSESDLKFIDWPAYHLEDWEFVLIRTRPTASQPYTPNDLSLEDHVGGWWLFKRVPPS